MSSFNVVTVTVSYKLIKMKSHVSPISISIISQLLLLFMLIIPIDIDFYYHFLRSSIDLKRSQKKKYREHVTALAKHDFSLLRQRSCRVVLLSINIKARWLLPAFKNLLCPYLLIVLRCLFVRYRFFRSSLVCQSRLLGTSKKLHGLIAR